MSVTTATIDTSGDTGPTLEQEAAAQDSATELAKDTKNVPEQFVDTNGTVDMEGLTKHLLENDGKTAEAGGEPESDPPEADPDGNDADVEAAKETVEEAGLDFDSLSAEYAENGALSEEAFGKLEAAGIPKAMVEQFIAGQEAIAETRTNAVYSEVGGEDAYKDLITWANSNMSADEVNAYNEVVTSGDTAKTMFAVKSLQARFEATNGKQPTRQLGGTPSNSQDVYVSHSEYVRDMQNPLYEKDEGFRARIYAKMQRSTI